MHFSGFSRTPALRLILFALLRSLESVNGLFPGNETTNCTGALYEFAKETAQFTHCAIVNARPIKLCEFCAENYINVTRTYSEILELKDHSGSSCKNKYINLDRLEIIENGYMYVQNLWENGHCESCFEVTNSTEKKLSNDTLEFQILIKTVEDCFSLHYESGRYDPSVCEDCGADYNKMNNFYEKLKVSQGDGKVCVDIVDSVNSTRGQWSQVLSCDRKVMIFEAKLIAAIISVSLLPLIFYVTTKHLTSQVGTRLTQQKRLLQTFSINAPSSSR